MKDIRLFIRYVWAVLMLFALQLQIVSAQTPHRVDGKVSFVIEKKNLTLQEAQAAISNKTAIPLKVSIIFEREWVDLFDNGFTAYINSSAFAFGIATKETGRDDVSNPLYKTNPPAWIYSASALGCTAADGSSLSASLSPSSFYIRNPNWEVHNAICPEYAYGTLFSSNDPFDEKYRSTIINGKRCYILDLFNMYFRLKDLQSVYVRGVDCNNASDGVASTDNESDLGGATVGTTILNVINTDMGACYWPSAPNPQAADWTLAPKDYYGGVIPGGIFIEQVPELTQFERSMIA